MDFSISTASMNQALEDADNLKDFLKQNEENLIRQSLSEHLTMLLKQKGLRRADVIRNSGMDKAYVHQIFKGEKKPSRDKLIAIAFGLRLNKEETQRMLKLGGCSELYAKTDRDIAILFAIQHGMDIWETDELLADNGFSTILDSGK